MSVDEGKRPFDGYALHAVLQELATINVLAFGLKHDLEPLSAEDIEAGAEPLTPAQIQDDLEIIQTVVTRIVVEHLRASTEEWVTATDTME
nr:hypothetical protein [uncultured Shinella sp.]